MIYIGIGSNIEPERNIPEAIRLLRQHVRVTAASTFYCTEPLGAPGTPPFCNGVLCIETDRPPQELKYAVLRAIENKLGRNRTTDRNAPRTIDLDILTYDDLVLREPDIEIPDPDIRCRAFLAVPLAELNPGLMLPDSGDTIVEAAASLSNEPMTPLPEFTRVIREEIIRMNHKRVEELIRELLIELGEDPDREGLKATPSRVASSYAFLLRGYNMSPESVINKAIFTQDTNNMVVVRDIELYSLCEHHMLPFFGRCHIGYISNGNVLGVSKLARLVDCYARRLQIQERLTQQIAKAVMNSVNAEGVGVVIEAQHLCMMMRGVQKQNSLMTTSSVLGSFHDSAATRNEFLNLIGRRRD